MAALDFQQTLSALQGSLGHRLFVGVAGRSPDDPTVSEVTGVLSKAPTIQTTEGNSTIVFELVEPTDNGEIRVGGFNISEESFEKAGTTEGTLVVIVGGCKVMIAEVAAAG